MGFPLIFRAPNAATTTFWGCKCGVSLCDVAGVSMKKKAKKEMELVKVVRVNAMAERGGGREAVDGGGGAERESVGGGFTSSAMEVTTFNQRFRSSTETEFPVWEKIGAVVRLSYGIGEFFSFFFSSSFLSFQLYFFWVLYFFFEVFCLIFRER